MKCKCGAKLKNDSNFCHMCGEKQRELCDCWVVKGPYNCGKKKCPGINLLSKLIKSCFMND